MRALTLCLAVSAFVVLPSRAADFQSLDAFIPQSKKFPGFPPSAGERDFTVRGYFKVSLPDWMTWEISGDGAELGCVYSRCLDPHGDGGLIGPGGGKSRVLGGIQQMSGTAGSYSTPVRANPALAIRESSSHVDIETRTKDPAFKITKLETNSICDTDGTRGTPSSFWTAGISVSRLPGQKCAAAMPSYVPVFPAETRDPLTGYKKGRVEPYPGLRSPAISFRIDYKLPYTGFGTRRRLPYRIQTVCIDGSSASYVFAFDTRAELFTQLHPMMERALKSFELLEPAPGGQEAGKTDSTCKFIMRIDGRMEPYTRLCECPAGATPVLTNFPQPGDQNCVFLPSQPPSHPGGRAL